MMDVGEGGRKSQGVQISPVQQMISSCSGAILTSVFVTPLDVVKIRLQSQSKPLARGQCFLYCNGLMDHVCTCLNGNGNMPTTWYKKPSHFSGTIDAFVKITRYEGVTSLWSGLPPTLAMAVPATVVYFTCYDNLKYMLKYSEATFQDWWKPVIAGSIARVWAVSMISPLELIRTKMQSEQLSYKDVNLAIQQTIQKGGVLSLWRGLGPTLLRDVPFSALYWLNYELAKSYVLQTKRRTKLNFSESFASGALSGTVAAILTLPFDVIKTHRQIALGQASFNTKTTSSSTWVLMKKLYFEQGFKSLFSGLVPRIIKVAPACAIMISTYEHFKLFFYTLNEAEKTSIHDHG